MAGEPSTLTDAQRDRAHAYFAAFLSPAAADEAAEELGERVEDGEDLAVLAAAHALLHDRVELGPDVEVPVLAEDLGLGAHEVARVTGQPVAAVEAILAREGLGHRDRLVFDDLSAGGPAPPSPLLQDAPRAARRWRWWLGLALLVVGGAVAAVVATGGDDEGAAAGCTPTPQQPVCLVEARVTDVVSAAGPGAARHRFEAGEPVRLWFRFRRVQPGAQIQATFVWMREGEALYGADFPLPQVSQANVTLLEAYREPGDYRVQIRVGDQLLVERVFEIVGP